MPSLKFLRSSFLSSAVIGRRLLDIHALEELVDRGAVHDVERIDARCPSSSTSSRPFSSTTIEVRYTVRNGTFPMKWMPIIIMRATQKKMMSGPVTRTLFG